MNTFGTATDQFPIYDARSIISNRARFRREMLQELERANTFYCPAGRLPFYGWVLMARSDYDELNEYATDLQLNIDDTDNEDNVGTLKNLSIVQAQCVTRGIAEDENAIYLVEITDRRGLLHNQWFQFPLIAQYNIRVPAYPQTFYLETMNDYATAGAGSKTTWTWSTMLQDIWTEMSNYLGTWPGLPITPLGTPEGFSFTGVSALHALCDVLEHLGLSLACDLSSDTPYTIVRSGATDAAFSLLQTTYETHLEDDLEWLGPGAGRVPGVIKVLFRRRNSVYGTEEVATYRNDSLAQQWSTQYVYTISVNAPSEFTGASGTHYIWSDFTIRYDDNSSPLAEDIATATTIAQQRVLQYFHTIYDQTAGLMTQTYAGALPFKTGSLVDGVKWYQNRDRSGWRTQIVRQQCPLFPEIYANR